MFGFPNWIVLLVVAALSAGSATYVTREVYQGDIAELQLAHAQDRHQAFMEGRARQMRSDAITRTVSADFHTSNVRIIRQTQTVIKEIPTYVQDDATCITWGLIRVHDAFALGTDPAKLDLSPGQSNDACAGIGWRALASTIGGNYGKYHEISDQLSHLQGWVDQQLLNHNAGANDGVARQSN